MAVECGQHREKFSEYLDGELGERERAALEGHLAECAPCRRELDMLRRTVRAVAGLPAPAAPSGFADQVVRRLQREAPAAGRGVIILLWSRVLPVAAMLMLVVGLTLTVRRTGLFEERIEDRTLAMAVRPPAEEMPGPPPVEEAREAVLDLLTPLAVSGVKELSPVEAVRVRVEEQLKASAELRGEMEAEDLGRRRVPAAVMTGAPDVARRGVAEVPMGAPAFSWRAIGGAGDVLQRARARGDGLVFTQMVARDPARLRESAQQLLTLTGDDPTDLMRRAVAVANSNGLVATLSFGEKEADGGMDVYLVVPASQYDGLLRQLVGLASPDNQMLANTGAAKGEFFRIALANYATYRAEEADQRVTEEAERAAPARKSFEGESMLLGRMAGFAVASRAPAMDESPVNLMIRVKQK